MKDAASHRPLRAPETVMRLSRLGSLHQCRLSFMRQLLRRMAREGWAVSRRLFEIDAQGVGRAVYTAQGPERAYSLVAFAHDLPPEKRSDRVIADAWDATFALFDGIPDEADLARLAANVPLQEAGRISQSELSLSRANRSVRLWDHVVAALAQGAQPEREQIDAVGYLMRTTAVYGSGKFGAADREVIADRPEMQAPFQAEMLSVWLTRSFVRDLVEHMARVRGGDQSARLSPEIARRLGIGNSTGLGMAPFLINHPRLLNNWIAAREAALARIRALPRATPGEAALFAKLLARVEADLPNWRSAHPLQRAKLEALAADIAQLRAHLADQGISGPNPWDALYLWAEATLGEDAQELLVSLMLEPYGALVDELGATMADSAPPPAIDGSESVAALRAVIETSYAFALETDWRAAAATARAWYVSEEKLEPRLGERHEEPIAPYEQPLAPARDIARLHDALLHEPDGTNLADFLARHPEHRHAVARLCITRTAPYAEIRDNTIAADLMPIDMLRAKLSFFGATCFDPRSDRWVRICMYAGAPYPEELSPETADLWVYPGAPA